MSAPRHSPPLPRARAPLAEQLASIAGRFVMSINATPFVRECFSHFRVDEIETIWTLSTAATGGGKRVTELIIRSRD